MKHNNTTMLQILEMVTRWHIVSRMNRIDAGLIDTSCGWSQLWPCREEMNSFVQVGDVQSRCEYRSHSSNEEGMGEGRGLASGTFSRKVA